MPMPRPFRGLFRCLTVLALPVLAGCATGADLPPPAPPHEGPTPALVDLDTLPRPVPLEDPGPALLRRAQGIRGT